MKHKAIYIRLLLLTTLILLSIEINLFSQGTDISTGKQPGLFLGINMGLSQSKIINTGTLSVENILIGKKSSFFGSIEFGYYFSDYFGLSSGVGFVSYKTQITLDAYQSNFNTIDSESESYEIRVTGTDIKELQNIGYLSIPICLNIRIPFGEKIGFFIQPGVNIDVPLSKDYKSSGTFTYKGYYPAYNVLLENLPDYGFPSNLNSNDDGELNLKSMGFDAVASAGFDFYIQRKLQIAVAACYNKSLSGISEYSSPDDFQLSSDPDEINSFMGGSTKATIQSMGVKIMFRYYLKSAKKLSTIAVKHCV